MAIFVPLQMIRLHFNGASISELLFEAEMPDNAGRIWRDLNTSSNLKTRESAMGLEISWR